MPDKHIELHDQVFDALDSLNESVEDLHSLQNAVGYLFPKMAEDIFNIAQQVKAAHDRLRDAHIDGVKERVRYSDEVSRNLMEVAMHTFTQRGIEQEIRMTDSAEVPWDDLKVAFDFEGNEELLWDTLYPDYKNMLPKGWSLNETDSSGARYVVVFRVDGILTVEDAVKVRDLLNNIK